ncbi:hypothetical protein PR202_gb03650 [Eleusine coracana subsp. coracana]|uniref:Uncharacterized protein n=1 Tax=Eleusine coracana subsp. coracana TaxID=191504 RepID=A0AAV5E1R2_ELECO|nr:hypothetical protein QOZ80_1BG0097540 [Eleusine coracana subsp. coracana]GJN16637.1 hypothetical protein PR202_gb03650 [Eleusine coracana subsp. coracana]
MQEMGKRHDGLLGCLLLLLCIAGSFTCWLPSVAAEGAHWHPDPDALPPLSAPPPTAGADLPHFGFPLQPTLGFAAAPPSSRSSGNGDGYPFIGSNPTVPLPTGMTDTTTVLPMPDTGAATATKSDVVGHAPSVPVHITIIVIALFFSILFLLSSTSCC